MPALSAVLAFLSSAIRKCQCQLHRARVNSFSVSDASMNILIFCSLRGSEAATEFTLASPDIDDLPPPVTCASPTRADEKRKDSADEHASGNAAVRHVDLAGSNQTNALHASDESVTFVTPSAASSLAGPSPAVVKSSKSSAPPPPPPPPPPAPPTAPPPPPFPLPAAAPKSSTGTKNNAVHASASGMGGSQRPFSAGDLLAGRSKLRSSTADEKVNLIAALDSLCGLHGICRI